MVIEISAFQYEACDGFRAGDSVHKLFVGGVTFQGPLLLRRINFNPNVDLQSHAL